jgi:hypothetical protein
MTKEKSSLEIISTPNIILYVIAIAVNYGVLLRYILDLHTAAEYHRTGTSVHMFILSFFFQNYFRNHRESKALQLLYKTSAIYLKYFSNYFCKISAITSVTFGPKGPIQE